ncbi:hypothetical protein GGG16DRAFT_119895 [Schizophyllum commune]
MPGVCGFNCLGVHADALSRDVQDDPLVADVNGAGTFLLRTGTLCSSHPDVESIAHSSHRVSSKYDNPVRLATIASAIHIPPLPGAASSPYNVDSRCHWVSPPRNFVDALALSYTFRIVDDLDTHPPDRSSTRSTSYPSPSTRRNVDNTTPSSYHHHQPRPLLADVFSDSIADDIACIVRESTENAVTTPSQGYILPSGHHEPRPSPRREDSALCAVPRFRRRARLRPTRESQACVTTGCFTDRTPDPLGDAEAAFKGLETVVVLSTPSPLPSQPNPNGEPRYFLAGR